MWQRRLKRAYGGAARGGPHARQPLRLPSVTARVAILGGLLVVVVGVLVFRLWFLQVLDRPTSTGSGRQQQRAHGRDRGAARRDPGPQRRDARRQPARPGRRHPADGRATGRAAGARQEAVAPRGRAGQDHPQTRRRGRPWPALRSGDRQARRRQVARRLSARTRRRRSRASRSGRTTCGLTRSASSARRSWGISARSIPSS